MSKLTPKQERFVEEYLVDLNATQAAIRPGYSRKTAYSIGQENLKKPGIQDFLAKAKTRLLTNSRSRAHLVIEGLERIIKANILDYIDLSDPRRPIFDLSRITRDQGALYPRDHISSTYGQVTNQVVRQDCGLGSSRQV
jgi:phage terminase small subunit